MSEADRQRWNARYQEDGERSEGAMKPGWWRGAEVVKPVRTT
jgi:hypothetical protein